MLSILLYESQSEKRIKNIIRGLRDENIGSTAIAWKPGTVLSAEIFEADIIVFYNAALTADILRIMPLIRHLNRKTPFLVIDAMNDAAVKQKASDLGVSAYYGEPVVYRDLAATIKALVAQRKMMAARRWLRIFDVLLDTEHRVAKRKNCTVRLRNKEFALLEFFMMNPGKVLTRNSILEWVWDRNAHFASNTVDVHINRLRRKLDDPFREKLIHTIPCIGYIFDKQKNV